MGILKAIIGRVDLDGSGFEKGAIKVENAAARLGKKVSGELTGAIGGALAGFGVGALTTGVLEAVGRIHQLSQQFRVSTDEIQRWDIAAHKVGQDAETIGSAMNHLKKV